MSTIFDILNNFFQNDHAQKKLSYFDHTEISSISKKEFRAKKTRSALCPRVFSEYSHCPINIRLKAEKSVVFSTIAFPQKTAVPQQKNSDLLLKRGFISGVYFEAAPLTARVAYSSSIATYSR